MNVTPTNPWLAHPVRIVDIQQELADTATYELEFEEEAVGSEFRFRPGHQRFSQNAGLGRGLQPGRAHERGGLYPQPGILALRQRQD